MNPLLEGNSLLHYKTSHYVAEKYPFWLSIKKTVNDTTVNIRKVTKKRNKISFFSSKCFPCRVKHLSCLTESIMGAVLGQRDALN